MVRKHAFFTKIFSLFDFGHFFCPILKSQNTFPTSKNEILFKFHFSYILLDPRNLKPACAVLFNNLCIHFYITKHISINTICQYRRYYVRENKNNVCPTLTANMGGGGHNVPIILDDKGIRKITPRECFNLQGFPSNYQLPNLSASKLYSLAGNAVSVPVVKLIANKIMHLM